ncbi:hypothetical protein SAMN04488498_101187 [Mesorhizobium albiziae]|uniref:Lytic murein transglycosylase n=1 Tax=Neomesorhizobium albiziae TaxID=335020 RepID=A0A1I3V7I9_9HYPH|nr:hypothetical protein SAMN04488498_101187 [Mesorhizobium albiziae]
MLLSMLAPYVAPLCAAGNLPLKGGDWPAAFPSLTFNVAERAAMPKPSISPLVGEMSGRTEGGATKCDALSFATHAGVERRPSLHGEG